jgi:hypothetical protein
MRKKQFHYMPKVNTNFFFLFLLLTPYIGRSQEKEGPRNTVYAEILGNAAGLSINYDRVVLKKEKIALSICIGAGFVPSNAINKLLNNNATKKNYLPYGFPISCNLIYGKNNHHLETGVGLTYQQGMYGEGLKYSQTIFAVVRLGYRYQKENGGLFWKIGFTPFIPIKEFGTISVPYVFLPFGGIALGYTF